MCQSHCQSHCLSSEMSTGCCSYLCCFIVTFVCIKIAAYNDIHLKSKTNLYKDAYKLYGLYDTKFSDNSVTSKFNFQQHADVANVVSKPVPIIGFV